MENEYFLGLDIGTDSVGYAVTDTEYKIHKFRGRSMWGVSLFENANQSADRRASRCSRRRIARVRQRIDLTRELFAVEIAKKDPKFYRRLDESFLYTEDRTTGSTNSIFEDEDFTDKDYHEKYHTIHHLIMDLINDKNPHDVRLVYLAVSYIISHRGHFLNEADGDDIDKVMSFDDTYNQFSKYTDSDSEWRSADKSVLSEVLSESDGIKHIQSKISEAVFGSAKPSKRDKEIIKAISGGEFKLSVLFENALYAESENDKLSFSKSNADDTIESMMSILGDDAEVLLAMKNLYGLSVIRRMMNGSSERYISNVKIAQYEKHRDDLRLLKGFVRKYLPDKYNEVFREVSKDGKGYTAYSKNYKNVPKKQYASAKNSNIEQFSDYIKKLFKNVVPDEEDSAAFAKMMEELDRHEFMPKQRNGDNRLIPYQLYRYELKAILSNAEQYLDFLRERDDTGLSVSEKLLTVMEFKIPYYVGPLNKYKSENAWIERKKGRILPWNFDEMVDKDKSEEAFIKRMTGKCTYLAGEDVLPKCSLLYEKFAVLNHINKIKLDGEPISVELKQELYKDLFEEKKRRVSKKTIKSWLLAKGLNVSEIDGIDDIIPVTLKSHHIFRRMLRDGILTEADAEKIIARATMTTDKRRLKNRLRTEFELSDDDVAYLARQSFSEYGRLSAELLSSSDIEAPNPETGEMLTIIRAMWETNCNLMELLSANFDYGRKIAKHNDEYYDDPKHGHGISDMLKEMYVSNSVKRAIYRTIDIVKEICHIEHKQPKKIFVEVPRGDGEKVRTISRKQQLFEKYKTVKEDEYSHLLDDLKNEDEEKLRSKKLYLFYMQLGKCMYSGEKIDLGTLLSSNSAYDIDHIYPQSRIKDDSFDNMVLVKKDLNGKKSDTFPISANVRSKMSGFWKMLYEKKLITSEKLYRLTRSTGFTDEELGGFINRQIVETSQSAKAAAKILKEICPASEIVYVKARLISDFRKTFELAKCRELNDLHHAKDAYLNIVMGNVYNVRFTKNPWNFIKEKAGNRAYTVKLTDKKGQGLLAHDIQRGDEIAWKANGTTLAAVKKTMRRNDINYVRYAFCRQGQLFDVKPVKAQEGEGLAPIKKGLDTKKYGGYNKTKTAFFTLVKHTKGKKEVVSLLPVEILFADKFKDDDEWAIKYIADKYHLKNARFATERKIIKINTMIEFENGFRANIASKSNGGTTIVLSSATSLLVGTELEKYVVKICSAVNKAHKFKSDIKIYGEEITVEKNLMLYDRLTNKINANVFSAFMDSPRKAINENRGMFEGLSIEEQVSALYNMLALFKTGRTGTCDLTRIGGVKKSGTIMISSALNKHIRIIDQSPTGLLETKSEDLLTL